MGFIAILIVLAGIAWLDVPKLIQERAWRELGVYALVWSTGATLAILLTLKVPMPITTSYISMLTHGLLSLFGG